MLCDARVADVELLTHGASPKRGADEALRASPCSATFICRHYEAPKLGSLTDIGGSILSTMWNTGTLR
jgi:hypothetical protein